MFVLKTFAVMTMEISLRREFAQNSGSCERIRMIRHHTIIILLTLFILVGTGSVFSKDYETAFRDGARLYRAGLLVEAERVFKDLRKEHRDSLAVLHYLGKINFRQNDFGQAKDWYNDIIKLKNDDFEYTKTRTCSFCPVSDGSHSPGEWSHRAL